MLKKILFSLTVLFFTASCGNTWDSVKRGLTGQKSNSTDEFLVEKKDPLVLPPNFEDLLEPSQATESEEEIEDFQKTLEDDIDFCISLSTGFSNSLRNSEEWNLSTGLLFNRFKDIPITIGISLGGTEKISSGFSIGYKKGPILINYGFKIRDGIFIQSMQGFDLSASLLLNIK